MENVRVLIVAEHASAKFGGEAFLPLHYFRQLRERGVEAWLLTHQRVQDELEALFPLDRDRIHYVPDTRAHVALHKLGEPLPGRLNDVTLCCASQLLTQWMQRRMVRRLVRRHGITVVHSPAPVSPRLPSALFDVDAPVVIGPMNGGMTYPSAFSYLDRSSARSMHALARAGSNLANLLLPGKRRAAALLVANARTEAALPEVTRDVPVLRLVENGVDLARFSARGEAVVEREPNRVRFAFVGRLVDWKGVDLLLEALTKTTCEQTVELEVFGAGAEQSALSAQAERLGLGGRVTFHGFVPQEQTARRLVELDGLVLPSLYECGGAVVLEAMASALPVIATRWGGPADYLDDTCGVLIDPVSREHVVDALARAMSTLAADPALRKRMGAAGRAKVELEYDWARKVDSILDIYQVVQRPRVQELTAEALLAAS